jgi:hypothetical protein
VHPIATVITAVWHQQANKESLLRGHMRNLRRQSAPYRAIYVFDASDTPPSWLEGTTISVSDPLTIYQAWNIALANVRTPLVMNLNVDDRLAPDAIEIMAQAFDSDPDVFLVGGDWKVCFDEAETDDVRMSYSLADLPYYPDWPPTPGRPRRLGSGDQPDATHGPACMWRIEAHRRMPRYPYRFADDSNIRIIADALWWYAIEHYMNKKILRLPLIIGNYRSAPSTQAEFRYSASEERAKQDIALL